MRSADEPTLDVDDILAQYTVRVAAISPRHAALAARYVHGLMPPRWTLEWFLPWWLGSAFGLDVDLCRRLVLSNIFGLVSVRLEDDLRDGELAPSDVQGARQLGPVLFDEAVAVYRTQIHGDAQFWDFLDSMMATWRAGADGADGPSRGAPIKIAAFATCQLGGRPDLWPVLDRCLDHTVSALVHYDQFCDWETDLAAGRWNAFVASVAPHRQRRENLERNRAAVLAAMLSRAAVEQQFGAIQDEAAGAILLAAELGLRPLEAYLSTWAEQVDAQGAGVASHYRGAANRAAQAMFGNAVGGASR